MRAAEVRRDDRRDLRNQRHLTAALLKLFPIRMHNLNSNPNSNFSSHLWWVYLRLSPKRACHEVPLKFLAVSYFEYGEFYGELYGSLSSMVNLAMISFEYGKPFYDSLSNTATMVWFSFSNLTFI